MSTTFTKRTVISLSVIAAQPACAQEHDVNVLSIESSLAPAFIIEGEEPPTRSLSDRMQDLGVPALSVAVIDDGRIAWTRAWGTAALASGRAATPLTMFQAASMSKPVAAMAALSLVDAGPLTLDGVVNHWLRTWRVPQSPLVSGDNPVTLRSLLNHTAGLNVHGFPGFGPAAEIPSAAGILRGEGNSDPVAVEATPGAAFRYSGGGYTVMQQLVEDVTDTDFASFANETVLRPLGMNHSGFFQPLSPGQRDRSATGYWDVDRPVDGGAHTYPQLAAAGLWTTPTDLARFMLSVYEAHDDGGDHEVLSSDTLAEMLEASANEWGLGPEVSADGTRISHGGANEGFRCWMTMSLVTGDGVVVMTNSDGGGQLSHEMALSVAREYAWPQFRPEVKRVVALSDEQYRDVTGIYTAEGWGSATVVYQQGLLLARPTWAEEGELLPETDSDFFVRDTAMPVRFIREDGEVVAAQFGSWRFERTGSSDEGD